MSEQDPDLTPQQAERVRRLLAGARHDEPLPEDVAARLDRVLAGLSAERTPPGPDDAAPVVRLAERRRRAGRLLLAAAVVVVGGVAVGQLLDGAPLDAGSSQSAGSGADERRLSAPQREDASDRDGSADQQDSAASPQPGAVSGARRSISQAAGVVVRPTRFATDAERARPVATGRATRDTGSRSELRARDAPRILDGCAAGSWGGGRYLRAAFGREAGWLVYRAPQGDTQVVEVFLCGEDEPERSATIPFD